MSRLFKQSAKVGFSEFASKVKIKEAKKLLRDTCLSIEDISSRLGYQNVESFIRLFRRLTGKTPAGYRRKK